MEKKILLQRVYTQLAREKIILRDSNSIGHWFQTAAKLPRAAIETQLKQACHRRYKGNKEVLPRVLKYANFRKLAEEIENSQLTIDI